MKRSERILLGLFALVFLVIVGGGGLSFGLSHYRGIQEETERLSDRLVEMNMAITQGAEWQRRSEWLEAEVPAFASRQEASTRLLEVIQREADKTGLALAGREFMETTKELGPDGLPVEDAAGFFDQATVRVTLTAVKEQAFFTWMHAVQQPGSFLGVTRLLMNPSGKDKTINAEVEVTQFYREGAATKAMNVQPRGGES
ncbi:hypothetical protein EI77_04251 [Prosthecobacter fusiformis]|uniref:Uncharacterized protein n=1 Tax=Prosthecobacter fusiformis TaxID=48464 RepID=A0A4R7RIV0_9BACT|nr:hypothetical protein [Prosthecobacter fusiformis]TDU64067.1 hypothetical protein EI77_04251 [Prosthecobacter fusiformis]